MKDFERGLTAKRLREVLKYDPMTGQWTFLVAKTWRRPVGSAAGELKQSGYGVFWSKQKGAWQAKINPSRKQVHLGFFSTAIEAHYAYEVAARAYFGEFARAA